MSQNLPEFPNLDHLKKKAKNLLRELRQHNPETKLSQAQHIVAQEYGFASWPKLKAHIESLPSPATPSPTAEALLFPRFTEKARRTVFFARYLAVREEKRIEPAHLLRATMHADPDLANRLLPGQFDALPAPGPEELSTLRISLLERNPLEQPLSSSRKRVLEQAAKEADRMRHTRISTGHFLLSFLCDEVAQIAPTLIEILREKGIRIDAARSQINRFLNQEGL